MPAVEEALRVVLGDKGALLGVFDLRVWYPLRQGLLETILRRRASYVRAVDGISFVVREGETFCLVGESGCGKTTTGKSLLRLTPITTGVALFRPRPETLEEVKRAGYRPLADELVDLYALRGRALKAIKRDIAIIQQDPYSSLNPSATVREILEEPLLVHGIARSRDERLELVYRALERVKLTPAHDFADRYPHQLSGGQRQRVAIARAIITSPRLVVADEPVSMLDASIRAEILELMTELKRESKLTYIFVTHDLAVARYICDRVAVMYLGRIVEEGDVGPLIERPLHPYTSALVAAVPEPEPANRLRYREVPIKGEVPNPVNVPPGCRFHPRCVALDAHASRLGGLCTAKEPPSFLVNGRRVSCWLYGLGDFPSSD